MAGLKEEVDEEQPSPMKRLFSFGALRGEDSLGTIGEAWLGAFGEFLRRNFWMEVHKILS